MINEIRYFRTILNALTDDVYPDESNPIRLVWTTGNPEKFKNQRISHEYANEVYYHLLEARMQLGNLLKYVDDNPNPYEQTDDIVDPVDTADNTESNISNYDTKEEKLNYVRGVLEEMQEVLNDMAHGLTSNDYRTHIHIEEAISNLALARNYCGKILECIKNIRDLDE